VIALPEVLCDSAGITSPDILYTGESLPCPAFNYSLVYALKLRKIREKSLRIAN
jgi:hypothetical protein